MTMAGLVLASGSAIRRDILTAAGVPFRIVRSEVDEAAIKAEATAAGLDLEEAAARLADAKALAAGHCDGAYVIGADQILEFEGRGYDKPRDMADARARLLELQGAAHTLINAVSIARDGDILWRGLARPALYMRAMTEGEIDAYLDAAGPEILASVGAYQVEGLGARLFERIEGDYFAVLGLGLYPLLGFLRDEGVLPF